MAPSGRLSKNSPLCHAQILGMTPYFKILFSGDPHPLQILKFSRKNLCPFLKKNFFQKFGENFNFGELGELPF